MAFDRKQFRDFISQTLQRLDMATESAINLLLGTAAQESLFGTYLKQINGPARGVYQMEPATEADIWENFLKHRRHLADRVWVVSGVDWINPIALEGNLIYGTVMARIHYLRRPELLPDAQNIEGLARYWKNHWNTASGAGTVEQFMQNYMKFVI